MILTTLDIKPNCNIDAGKIFAKLLSYKHKDNIEVLSILDVTRGYCFYLLKYNKYYKYLLFKFCFFRRIDSILKDCNDYLVDYPQFFSYIAAIIGEFFTIIKFSIL